MREIRRMPSALDLDVLRQTLGPTLVAPYARAFGPVPWLTAGTLTWPAADARAVAEAWDAWADALPDRAPTALRVTGAVVAVDVALPGDPAGALLTVAPLRALGPHADSIGSAAPAVLLGRAGGTPAPVAGASVAARAATHAACAARRPRTRARGHRTRRPPRRRGPGADRRRHRGRGGARARRRRPRRARPRAAGRARRPLGDRHRHEPRRPERERALAVAQRHVG